jgi:short-subunit dehydrogenase
MRALIIGNTDGIGLGLTRRLLASNHRVVGISRRASSVTTSSYQHFVCDVTSAEYPSLLRDLSAEHLDVCVYCAGIGERFDLAHLEADRMTFRVNLLGLAETVAVVLPAMARAGRGQLVGLSSIGDELLSGEAPGYSASKAGVSSYLAGLALAMERYGVTVSNVRLGLVNTKMAKAPGQPMMIEVERAVDVIMEVLASKRARITHPWRADWLVRAFRWLTLLRFAMRR